MKVLYITPYYKPSWFYGGPPKCISEQAAYLQLHSEIKVEVITLNLNGKNKLFNDNKVVVRIVDGVKVHYLPVKDKRISKKYFIAEGLKTYLGQFNAFDLIHIHTLFNFISRVGISYAVSNRIPFIVTPHGMLEKEALQRSPFLKKVHRYLYEDRLLGKAKFIQFMTVAEKEHAVLGKKSNAVVIPIGLQFNKISNVKLKCADDCSDHILRLLFVGRINKIKGLELLLNGLANVSREIRDKIILDIYGEDDDNHLTDLLQLQKQLGLHYVTFKGNLAVEKRYDTLQSYHALVLTSYLESFGIVVVEALESGIPVIVSEKVRLSNFVKDHNCGFTTSLKVEEISSTLERMYKISNKARLEMGNRGAQAVRKHFDMKNVIDTLISYYRS